MKNCPKIVVCPSNPLQNFFFIPDTQNNSKISSLFFGQPLIPENLRLFFSEQQFKQTFDEELRFAELQEMRTQSADDMFADFRRQLLKDQSGDERTQMRVEIVEEATSSGDRVHLLPLPQHLDDDDEDRRQETGDDARDGDGDRVL